MDDYESIRASVDRIKAKYLSQPGETPSKPQHPKAPSHIPNADPIRMRHKLTGETAFVRPGATGRAVWAQFDRKDHKHAHGWWAYASSEFEVME